MKNKKHPLFRWLNHTENGAAFTVLILITGILFYRIFARIFSFTGLSGDTDYVQHLVMWITFIGAMITTREGKHLSMTLGRNSLKGRTRVIVTVITAFITVTTLSVFMINSVSFALIGIDVSAKTGIIPTRFFVFIMPLGFLVMLIRFIIQTKGGVLSKVLTSLGIILGVAISLNGILFTIEEFIIMNNPGNLAAVDALEEFIIKIEEVSLPVIEAAFWPVLVLLIVSAFFGMPIFIVLGSIAVLLFSVSGSSLADISNEAYGILTMDNIPAIPLFTLAGFILSESKAGERFVRLFKAYIGWFPGGMAVVAVIVCAFFTTFTGASGVTILAMGGLLSFILSRQKYDKDFSRGLLTGSGSIGLLFAPSLPLIMYGVASQVNIKHMFVGGFIPGVIMVLTLAGIGIFHAVKNKVKTTAFKKEALLEPLRESVWELLLPVIILVSFFAGLTTLVETSALAVIYLLIIEVFIYRDIKLGDLPGVFAKCVPIIGGILIILAIAKGLNAYIVYSGVTLELAEWMKVNITSPIVFLILLNIGLLITGCFMDIFAAIIVVAPMVIELGKVYGINEVHLGVIFLANLQLGYLTPPVGMNLFLASYTFDAPLSKIYKDVVPFFIALLIAVLLITYIPFLSTGLLELFKI